MSLFTTNCVHECSEIQKIILFIFYPGRFYEDLSPPFTNICFFCKTENKVGREISMHSNQPRVFLHI